MTLIASGGFYEANPLMRDVIGSPSLGFLVKCILPALMLLFIRRMAGELGEREQRRVDDLLSFTLALYTALCVVHIVNFALWYGT